MSEGGIILLGDNKFVSHQFISGWENIGENLWYERERGSRERAQNYSPEE